MTALNKQALREMAERAASDSWGYDRDEFNDAITPEVVLALLDELEAAEKRIAELEARTVKLPTGTEVNGFHMLIEEEVIARLRESGVTPIVVRAAGISVKGE